jgi:hypothetical protein
MSNLASRRWRANGIALCVVLLGSGTAAAERPSASDCMSVQTEVRDDAVEFQLTNGCDRPLSCTVTWTLRCGEKPPLVSHPGRQSLSLEASEAASVNASAKACGHQDWKIADAAWACQPQ